MFNWIFTNFLRDSGMPLLPTQMTAMALLSSTIADGDVVTDWLYYVDILNDDDDEEKKIPKWLLTFQLVSCIAGTLSWLMLASDGRVIQLIRSLYYLILCTPILIMWTLVWIFIFIHESLVSISLFCFCCICCSCEIITCAGPEDRWTECCDPIKVLFSCFQRDSSSREELTKISKGSEKYLFSLLQALWYQATRRKVAFSSGALLIFGIFTEDIPQLIITFFIEDHIKSDGDVSNTAIINLLFAIFDMFHKLAQAYDLKADIIHAEFAVKHTFRVHSKRIYPVPGTSKLLALSEKIIHLWDIVSNKCIQTLECGADINHAAAIDTSKVIASCADLSIRIFDMETGNVLRNSKLDFIPYSLWLSPDLTSFFVSKYQQKTIRRRNSNDSNIFILRWDVDDAEFGRPLSTYKNQNASAMAFFDDNRFISTFEDSAHVWDVNEDDPLYTIKIHYGSNIRHPNPVITMSKTLFLVGDGSTIKAWKFVSDDWENSATFKGHTDSIISLAKVVGSLFVSTSYDHTAKLWNIDHDPSSCLFTFYGHSSKVLSSVYVDEEKAIATGDENGIIKMWSVEKFLPDSDRKTISLLTNGDVEDSQWGLN